jgi:hypothetical protein
MGYIPSLNIQQSNTDIEIATIMMIPEMMRQQIMQPSMTIQQQPMMQSEQGKQMGIHTMKGQDTMPMVNIPGQRFL